MSNLGRQVTFDPKLNLKTVEGKWNQSCLKPFGCLLGEDGYW